MEEARRSLVAGFDARHSAEQAADQLLKWGLDPDAVIVAVRDHDYSASGGVMVRSAESDAVSHLAELLALAGVPEDDAGALAIRFDSMDAVVAVNAAERSNEASTILRDFGGELDADLAVDRPAWNEAREVLRGHWEKRPAGTTRPWAQAEAGYHYVYEKSVEPEFRGQAWQSAEPKLQSGFEGWAAERGYQTPSTAWDWLRETLREIWSPATRGASPDDIVHPERLHRWVRLVRTTPVTEESV
jgi:hypothetical protein